MGSYYVAKFNVQPDVLKLYGEEYLINDTIPDNLGKIYSSQNIKNNMIKFTKETNFEEIKDSELFCKMLDLRIMLVNEYYSVSNNFLKTGEISYNKNYMGIRSQLKKCIEELFQKFPFLKSAEDIKIKSFSTGKTPEIQMGVVYIDRVEKIEKFLQSKIELKLDLEFLYDRNNERIYISDVFIDETNVHQSFRKVLEEIEDYINTFEHSLDFGKVSINPVYDNFNIKEGNYKEVTVIKVFPNGHPSKDRMKALNAAQEETKFKAPQNENINNQELVNHYKEDAMKGYIASIMSRGKNILENTILKIKI